MANFQRWITILACTVAGGVLGFLIAKAGFYLYSLPFFHHSAAKSGGLGDAFADFIMIGFYLGLLCGICVTLGTVGGFVAGLALARRAKPSVPASPQPGTV